MQQELYMRRCLDLASLGKTTVAPNPMVGAVLVYQDLVIGEGFHQQYGLAHAEVNCLESVAARDKHLVAQSTMYVSLEPCAHFGKTPPCAHRIVAEKIKRVVIGNKDPFEQVAGKGIQILKEQGIEVLSGLLEEEGNWLNRRFFTFHQQKRPYVILKWAQTKVGLFAPKDHTRFQLTDDFSIRMSHRWRSEEAAILVGFTTALNDNPQLIDRFGQVNQPLRIALDKDLKLPKTHYLWAQKYPTWIVNQHREDIQGHLHFIRLDFAQNIIPQLLNRLYLANKLSLIVEGGAQLLGSFIDASLWDEARIFESPNKLMEGLLAPKINGHKLVFSSDLRQDKLSVYLNHKNTFTMHQGATL